jgi:hypothetical protein
MKNIHKIDENIYITNSSDIIVKDYVVVSCSEVNIEEVRIVTGYYNEQFLFDDKSQIHMDYCKKIILTTDEDLIQDGVQSINDNSLKWFVKNPSCEEVEIKSLLSDNGNVFYGYKIIIPQEEIELNKLKKQFQMKADEALELNSKIGNFGKEEPKQETIEEDASKWSLEEAQKFALSKFKKENSPGVVTWKSVLDVLTVGVLTGHKFGAKWQEERMFELIDGYVDDVMGGCNLRAKEWFENRKL